MIQEINSLQQALSAGEILHTDLKGPNFSRCAWINTQSDVVGECRWRKHFPLTLNPLLLTLFMAHVKHRIFSHSKSVQVNFSRVYSAITPSTYSLVQSPFYIYSHSTHFVSLFLRVLIVLTIRDVRITQTQYVRAPNKVTVESKKSVPLSLIFHICTRHAHTR